MGTDIDAFIEIDDSPVRRPYSSQGFWTPTEKVIPLIEYGALVGGKDYVFIGALCGVRAPGDALFPRRGLPANVARQTYAFFDRLYHLEDDMVSWLWLHEIYASLDHMDVSWDDLSQAAQVVLRMMGFLEEKVGQGRARLVFGVT